MVTSVQLVSAHTGHGQHFVKMLWRYTLNREALSALEQGLWRLGADAGGHREAAQLLGR